MGGLIGVATGVLLSVFGFLVMRNPMMLAYLSFSPGSKGYYQRMILDTSGRNQLRVLGVLVSLFGSSILTASIGSLTKVRLLGAISEGLWVLMGCIFFAAWGIGLILAVRQLFKGQLFDWLRMWKAGVQLGPIDVFPPITPKMQREAGLFTIVFVGLLCVVVLVVVIRLLA